MARDSLEEAADFIEGVMPGIVNLNDDVVTRVKWQPDFSCG
jgi:hypothetical protein